MKLNLRIGYIAGLNLSPTIPNYYRLITKGKQSIANGLGILNLRIGLHNTFELGKNEKKKLVWDDKNCLDSDLIES
jgi:hypothetical protein